MGKKKAKKVVANSFKTAKRTSARNVNKSVVKSEVKSNMSRRPKWRFKKRDRNHERWHLEITEELLEKLMHFETMTWSEILVRAKKQNHYVQTYTLCREAQQRLTELKLDDYDEICSLRLSSTHRLYGTLDEDGVFSIIWNDLEHEIYPVVKKYT